MHNHKSAAYIVDYYVDDKVVARHMTTDVERVPELMKNKPEGVFAELTETTVGEVNNHRGRDGR